MNSLSLHLPEKNLYFAFIKKKNLCGRIVNVFIFIFVHIFFHIAKIMSDVLKTNEKKITHG